MKTSETKALWASLVAGLLFGAGLVIGGMTLPNKVTGFLDFLGAWDPTLMFVMGGAVMVHMIAYRVAKKRPSPFLGGVFMIPSRNDIDLKLVLGAAAFGVGWGLGGFCPGPALTSMVTGHPSVFWFVGAMLTASYVVGRLENRPGSYVHKAEGPRVKSVTVTAEGS